jgi:hypothetical protein
VLCKLDLEKAYDHVNWKFLLYLLRELWLKGKMPRMHCLLYLYNLFVCSNQ